MVIFHCYISSPEGINLNQQNWVGTRCGFWQAKTMASSLVFWASNGQLWRSPWNLSGCMFQKNGGYAPVTQVLGNVGNQKSLGLLTPLESTRHVLYLILVQTQSLQQKQDHSPLHQEKRSYWRSTDHISSVFCFMWHPFCISTKYNKCI